jgi:predicted kinase
VTVVLVAMTGLAGTGKSTIADAVGRALPAPVFSVDPIEATLNRAGITREHDSGRVAYDLAGMLAGAQLRNGQAAVIDSVSPFAFVRQWWADIARRHDAPFVLLATVCSDRDLHRARVESRRRDIDGFLYEPDWSDVAARIDEYEPPEHPDLVLDAVDPVESNRARAVEYVDRLAQP